MNIDDLQSEYGRAEYHEPDWNGRCDECGEPLIVKSQDNGVYELDQVGYCPKCDIYYS